MCGRFTLIAPPEAVARLFGVPIGANYPPRYNIAPTQAVPVVHVDAGTRQIMPMRWGLIPPWVKEWGDAPTLINARIESINEKPSFKAAFLKRRCLVPADGFYEWQARGKGEPKQPYYLRLKDHGLFAFAAIWQEWTPSGEAPIRTVAIATTDADPVIARLHDRMPVMLRPDSFAPWLGEVPAEADTLKALPRITGKDMAIDAISRRVNNVANDDEACIAPVDTGERDGML